MTLVNFINLIFGLGMLLNAISFLPQAWRLYRFKDSQELSLSMFIIFLITQITASLHGYFSHDIELMWSYLPSIVTCSLVVYFIVAYRIKKK